MTDAVPFKEAIANLRQKGLLPLNLNSAQIRQLDATLRRQSIFSAKTTLTSYLDEIKQTVASIIEPKQVQRGDDASSPTVTEGFNPASARQALREKLKTLGYAPGEDEAGTIKDLSSDARINLVVKTNTELAQGAGAFIKQNLDPDVVDEYPALEFIRFEERGVTRDWETRWREAAQEAGDPDAVAALESTGRMMALKASPIWDSLGNGAGGYDDTLGNPFPPFAFNSGMWTQEVSRKEAEAAGLLKPGQKVPAAALDLGELFSAI
jgi:hypothetical protein